MSLLKEVLERGGFAVTAEITDFQSATMKASSLATCKILKDEGLEPVLQITGRDRNRIAIQGELLSAAVFGIENVLALTENHTIVGDHPGTKPVYDLDSIGILQAASALMNGKDMGGYDLAGIIPLKSAGMAKYMNNNVSGVYVPDELIARLRNAENKVQEGIKITAEFIRQLREEGLCDGVHIMAIGAEENIPAILDAAGL